MKVTIAHALALWLIHLSCSDASTVNEITPAVRLHPRSLVTRAGPRDCGKFVMKCKGAEGACNNACYHINCVDKHKESQKMVFDKENNNRKNRQQSGCQTRDAGGSVCNNMPFSQFFKDAFSMDPNTPDYNCDEWPMATTKQDDFKEGTVRNSLRCIPGLENTSGGVQLRHFVAGDNKEGPKKTCDGTVETGDYWNVEFDLDDAKQEDIQNCIEPQCENDKYAFHMTKKQNTLSTPLYKPDKDNRYAVALNQPDLLLCRIVVHRHGPVTEATVYQYIDGSGDYSDEAGSETKDLNNKGDSLTVKGLPYETDVIYEGDDANPFRFQYAAGRKFWDTNLLKFFSWDTQSKGTDKSWSDDGSYCKKSTKSGNDYVYECYFPCSA